MTGPATLRRFFDDERGATAIEYALIAGGIAVAIVSTVWGVGSNLKQNWYDKLLDIF
jgi:pilus assembly protein Flp/PilA